MEHASSHRTYLLVLVVEVVVVAGLWLVGRVYG